MGWREEEVLVICKAYPSPSKKYGETVCTAGITKGGHWIRLYPVPYRDLPFHQRFKKFQWIKVNVQPALEKLSRPESHKIDAKTITLLNDIPPGVAGWIDREKYFLPLLSKSLEDLQDQQGAKNVSLGIFKPKEVIDFVIEESDKDWDEKKKSIVGQKGLFQKRSSLEKIPYKFSYRFSCNDGRCKGHKLIVLDWEAGESYRKFKDIYKGEQLTLEKMKDKWLNYFFRKRESYFVVGTDSEFGHFMVLTVISPQRKA